MCDTLENPYPYPPKTRTRDHGYGFLRVRVRVSLRYPGVTRDIPYLYVFSSPVLSVYQHFCHQTRLCYMRLCEYSKSESDPSDYRLDREYESVCQFFDDVRALQNPFPARAYNVNGDRLISIG